MDAQEMLIVPRVSNAFHLATSAVVSQCPLNAVSLILGPSGHRVPRLHLLQAGLLGIAVPLARLVWMELARLVKHPSAPSAIALLTLKKSNTAPTGALPAPHAVMEEVFQAAVDRMINALLVKNARPWAVLTVIVALALGDALDLSACSLAVLLFRGRVKHLAETAEYVVRNAKAFFVL